jgi:hypothetical protein
MKNMTFDGDPYPKNRTYDVDSDPAETIRTPPNLNQQKAGKGHVCLL